MLFFFDFKMTRIVKNKPIKNENQMNAGNAAGLYKGNLNRYKSTETHKSIKHMVLNSKNVFYLLQ